MEKGKLEQELVNFVVRVLQGNCTPQETAILPEILSQLKTAGPSAATDGPRAMTFHLKRQKERL